MNITFYYIVPNRRFCGVIYNEGVAVLSAIAKGKGCSVSLKMLDMSDFENGFSIASNIDVHAISFASQQFGLAKQVIDKISSEDHGHGKIVVGGVHATVDRQSIINLPNVDMVVSGEGEEFFEWLIENFDSPDECTLPNVYVRGKPATALCKSNYADLNLLPFPDRSIFDKNLLKKTPEFILSRGCPYSCSYCVNEFLNDTFGMKIRKKSPEYCVGEIDDASSLLDIHSDTMLTFHDDVFLVDNNWLHSFSELYRKTFNNPFRCNTTATAIKEEKVRLLKEMNCSEVWIGVETGNEEFRRNVLNKKCSNNQIIKAFDIINKYGLRGVSFNLFACPGETEEHVKDTIELNLKAKVYSVTSAMFVPFPGTTLYDKELGKDNIRDLSEEEKDLGVSNSGLKEKNITNNDYYYWRLMLRCKTENRMFLYSLLVTLKYFSFPAELLKKTKPLVKKYLVRNRIVFDRSKWSR